MTFVNQYIALRGWLGEKMTDNEKRFIKSIFSGDSSGHDYYHTIRELDISVDTAEIDREVFTGKNNSIIGATVTVTVDRPLGS